MLAHAESDSNPENPRARRAGSLAFFLPKMFDISGISNMRREVLGYADLIRAQNDALNPALPKLEAGFKESLEQLEGGVRTVRGVLALLVPRGINEYSRTHILTHDYAVNDALEDPTADLVLAIPSSKITAVSVLAFPRAPGDNHPVMDLRVQSSQAPTQSRYLGPGQTEELPGVGTWHRFPLSFVELGADSSTSTYLRSI